jgi:uncharacterized membrane protein
VGGPPVGSTSHVRFGSMEFHDVAEWAVQIVEGGGIVLLLAGGVNAFARFGLEVLDRTTRDDAYRNVRRRLARVILLGLEILLIADIIRTIVVDQSLDSVLVLSAIVIIRILLSFSLEVEIDGVWPWNRWRTEREPAPVDGS